MDLARPYRLISNPLDGSVLSVLAATTRPLTGREVARLAPEGSQPGIAKALGRLADEGLLERQEAGNALLYRLNRDHLAAPAATLLAELRGALIARLRDELESWPIRPVHASLFGSVARGDAEPGSDVDLLVIRPADVGDDDARWRDQLERLAGDVRSWTGNVASVSELSESELPRLAKERPPVVDRIVDDAITLVGPDAGRLFRAEAP